VCVQRVWYSHARPQTRTSMPTTALSEPAHRCAPQARKHTHIARTSTCSRSCRPPPPDRGRQRSTDPPRIGVRVCGRTSQAEWQHSSDPSAHAKIAFPCDRAAVGLAAGAVRSRSDKRGLPAVQLCAAALPGTRAPRASGRLAENPRACPSAVLAHCCLLARKGHPACASSPECDFRLRRTPPWHARETRVNR